jgi:hypothetical protein
MKELLAYTFLGFEILIVLWGVFLSVSAMYVQSKNKVYSIVVGCVFNIVLYSCLFVNSKILYN